GTQCEPHAAPSNRDSRPSSPAPCRLKAKGYLLPEFYSGATGRSGRFNEGLLLRRLQRLQQLLDRCVEGIEVSVEDGGCCLHSGRPHPVLRHENKMGTAGRTGGLCGRPTAMCST